MLRNTLSKVVFSIIFFLLITLTPFLLQAKLEQGIKIVSRTVPSDVMFIFQAQTGSGIDLYLAGPDGRIQQLTNTGFALNPSLSPDGKTVLFEGHTNSKIGGLFQIFKLDLDSKKVTQISNNSALDCAPACAPDGKHLAFCTKKIAADPNNIPQWRIYIMDIDGKNRHPLETQGETCQVTPSWAPDGTKIVFVYSEFLPLQKGLPLAFPIVTPKIRDLKTRTTSVLLPGGLAVNDTAWSPSGDFIAFRNHDPITDIKTIWIVSADGLHLERLTDGPDDAQPAWFPDGSKLVFIRQKKNKKGMICMIDLKTRKVTELFSSNDTSLEHPQVLRTKR